MEVSDKELAYIAGFFDGEGCIQTTGGYFTLKVSASNTDLRPLENIRNLLGGKVTLRRKQSQNCRAVYDWSIFGKPAATTLAMLLPYLIVKRKRALLGVKLVLAKTIDKVDISVAIRIFNKEGEA